MIITIDGCDGVGKSTQVQLLKQYFEQSGKFDLVSFLHFPVYENASGNLIETSLDDKYPSVFSPGDNFSLPLLFELNRRSVLQELLNAKNNSHIALVLDRYTCSGLSYAKPKLSEAEFIVLLSITSLVPEADITFILDISPITARVRTMHRKNNDSFEKNVKYQGQVRQAFLDLAQVYDWNVINVESKTREQVHEEILRVFNSKTDTTRK